MRELKPVTIKESEFDELEKRIRLGLLEHLYWPLMRDMTLETRRLMNASGSLLRAIQTGRVLYSRGKFSGRFTASISRTLKQIGATWNRGTQTWDLPFGQLSDDLKSAIATSEARFQEKLRAIDRKLEKLEPTFIASQIRTQDLLDRSLWKVDGAIDKTLGALNIGPKLTENEAARIAGEWAENLDRYIVDFTAEEILKLRKAIQENAFKGNRYEALVGTIKDSFGVAERKAKFLARQETNLLLSKYKEVRYQSAGVHEYRWRCVVGTPSHPVRPAHQKLNGKIFRFDNPPVTTEPGVAPRRNNPGQDYNCRCSAIPIVRFSRDTG